MHEIDFVYDSIVLVLAFNIDINSSPHTISNLLALLAAQNLSIIRKEEDIRREKRVCYT